MPKKNLRYACWKSGCSLRFKSWQERNRHITSAHPSEPVKTFEPHRLLHGIGLSLGQHIRFTKIGKIKSIKTCLGSDVADVEIEIIKEEYWQREN